MKGGQFEEGFNDGDNYLFKWTRHDPTSKNGRLEMPKLKWHGWNTDEYVTKRREENENFQYGKWT